MVQDNAEKNSDVKNGTHSDNEEEEEAFFDARFPPDEEAKLLAESQEHKSQANELFVSGHYSEAITIYDRALASCPNYLDFDIAVLRSNVAACHLKLEDWKAAVDAATASLECLERIIPTTAKSTNTEGRVGREGDQENAKPRNNTAPSSEREQEDAVVELPDDNGAEDEAAALKRLAEDDARREDVQRIRAKSLMRRGRARMEQGGWANLQGAEEDYKTLHQMKERLPPRDQRAVQEKLRELPALINVAREKEVGEMMGKLKDLGNGILKPFGLSTDNFKFTKDEATGGYSMSFDK